MKSRVLLVTFLSFSMFLTPQVWSQTTFNPDDFLEEIIDKLNEYKFYDGENFGWLYRQNSSSFHYDLVYNGYTMGIAGIGNFLIQAYQSGFNSSYDLINEIGLHFQNSAINTESNQSHWVRFANLGSEGWVGYRYGSAGILDFLANAQYMDIPSINSTLIENGINWMINTENDYGYWPISDDEGSYITTGLEYGGTGIASSLLKLYNLTGNLSFLDYSMDIADYLIDIAIINDPYVQMSWTPALDDTDFLGQRFTSIGVGEAGIMKYFDQLYQETQNQTYLDIATGFAEDLVSLNLGGYWSDGTVGYIDPFPKGGRSYNRLVGFSVGATGTSYELLKFYQNHGNTKFLDSAITAIDFVEEFLHSDGSVSVGYELDDYKYTGFGIGAAGVAHYFTELYKFDENPLYYAYANRIFQHLYDLIQEYGLIPIDEADLDLGYSFNIEDGLAGIGLALLNFRSVTPPENPYIFGVTPTTSNENKSVMNLLLTMVLFVIPMRYVIRKKNS